MNPRERLDLEQREWKRRKGIPEGAIPPDTPPSKVFTREEMKAFVEGLNGLVRSK